MSTVKGFYDKEGNIIPYDYKYLANSPTKLSDFTNDLFGVQREVVQKITKDGFVYDEVLQAYTFFIDSALTWLVVDENVSKVLGCDLLRYNSETSAYELVTEETSPFVVGSDKVITFENFRLFNGLRPSATGEYAEVDEFWVVCDNIDFGDEGYFSISHKYTKGLSNMEQVSSFVKVTIPNGRMRGDVNGDGKITSVDKDLIFKHISKISVLTDETQLLCADANSNGNIDGSDAQFIYVRVNDKKFGRCTDITSNWTNNPNYATEDGQFYTDIPITGMTANHSASVIVKGTFESGFFTKAECIEGAIRIYAKLCPISEVIAIVAFGKGDGTATITTESEDLTEYAEHVADATIHLPAVTTDDNGKILRVVNGVWVAVNNLSTVSTATLLASDWYSTCLYSFEIDYPSSIYDIEIALDSTATPEQAEAFNGAQIVGSATSNIVKAYGDVPTVDIPIILKVVTK